MGYSEGRQKRRSEDTMLPEKHKGGIEIFLSVERTPFILFIADGVYLVCFLEGFVAGVQGVAFDMKMCIVAP